MGPYIRCVLGEGLAMEPVGASGGRQSGDGRTTTAARRPRDAALRRDKKKVVAVLCPLGFGEKGYKWVNWTYR